MLPYCFNEAKHNRRLERLLARFDQNAGAHIEHREEAGMVAERRTLVEGRLVCIDKYAGATGRAFAESENACNQAQRTLIKPSPIRRMVGTESLAVLTPRLRCLHCCHVCNRRQEVLRFILAQRCRSRRTTLRLTAIKLLAPCH